MSYYMCQSIYVKALHLALYKKTACIPIQFSSQPLAGAAVRLLRPFG